MNPRPTHHRPSRERPAAAAAEAAGGSLCFRFRPWVRRACAGAFGWGLAALAVLAGLSWVFQAPGAAPVSRAFGVLALYGVIFLGTLAKIWWTAGGPAVDLGPCALGYLPLHGLRWRRIAYRRIRDARRQAGSASLRLLVEGRGGRLRELYLNLALFQPAHLFLRALGERLAAAGLEPAPGRRWGWERPAGDGTAR